MADAIEPFLAELRASPVLSPVADALIARVHTRIAILPRKARAADLRVGGSRIGGDPDLPPSMPWPTTAHGPIGFAAQLSLDALAPYDLEGRLPRAGMLSFFCGWTPEGTWDHAVFHLTDAALATRRSDADRRTRPQGIDFARDRALAPWSSYEVGADDPARRTVRYDGETGAYSTVTPSLCLTAAQLEAYGDLYARWDEAAGFAHHGLFGADRPMEVEQRVGEVMLLRLDDGGASHPFYEAVTLYFMISERALAAGDFTKVRAHYGASI